jgi:hypothetical protein
MTRSIQGYRLFQGFRGKPAVDLDTMERCLVSLADMVTNHPEIKELGINPRLVHPEGQGATAADCRIVLRGPDATMGRTGPDKSAENVSCQGPRA